MARIKYYTYESIMEILMKILFRKDGTKRSYREMAENSQLLKITRWNKNSKSHLGSFSRMLERLNISEMTLYEEARSRGLINLSLNFEEFSNNKKLHYNSENVEDINKPLPKIAFLKELAYRLGVEIDVSLMSEEEVYDFIKAMGHTEETIKEVEEEIKNIRYKG